MIRWKPSMIVYLGHGWTTWSWKGLPESMDIGEKYEKEQISESYDHNSKPRLYEEIIEEGSVKKVLGIDI